MTVSQLSQPCKYCRQPFEPLQVVVHGLRHEVRCFACRGLNDQQLKKKMARLGFARALRDSEIQQLSSSQKTSVSFAAERERTAHTG